MDSDRIPIDAAVKLVRRVRPMLAYLSRLRRRMELLGFPPDDKLYVATTRAFNAMQALHVQSHYCSCESGVGKTPKK